jgi:acyl-CoA thioesterase-1
VAALVALSAACGGPGESAKVPAPPIRPGGAVRSPVESTTSAAGRATGATAQPTTREHTGAPRVLFLGTSLTAGLGLDNPEADAYPAVLQRMADSSGVPALMVNAGLSGETSAGALRRVDWLMREKADVVVIETGANDGLRGLDPDSTAANLRALIGRLRAANPASKILLVQMEAPTNLGTLYTRRFHELFARVAATEHVALLPFLLNGVAGIPRFNQPDGIHPTPEGARMAARNVWPGIERALRP